MLKALLAAALLMLTAACGGERTLSPMAVAAESERLTRFLDAAFEEELQQSPQWLTQLGRKEQYDRLNDMSEDALDRALEWRRDSVAAMRRQFDYDLLDDSAKTSFDIWEIELERAEASARFRRHGYVFARGGVHVSLPNFMMNFHRVDTPMDMEAYIARVGQFDRVVDTMVERARLAAADGIRMPRFAYDQSLDEARRVLAGAPFSDGAHSPLYADAMAKIAALRSDGVITQAQADDFTARVTAAMRDSMRPAYDRLIAWLQSDRANASAEAQGVWALPDGAAYYQTRLELMTTTSMTANEIHELGLQEVARIREDMDDIREQVGFEGDLAAFFAFMRSDPRFVLPNTDAGRAEYIRIANTHIDAVREKLPDYFGVLPKSDVEVRRVEAYREEAGGAAFYQRAAPDGSRPGVFYAHLVDMNAQPIHQLETLTYHEALPGHHMQIAIAQELEGLPLFRTLYSYTAYTEGWGLYAETLGKEMGFFTDPYSDYGRLSGEMWRAIRLVVDTGLHEKRWTQEQAVQYALENSSRPEASVRSEVRRYLSMPGQATAYMIGMLEIQWLRVWAEAELGDAFDIRGFHDTVLGAGSLPLPILEKRVREWVAAELEGRDD